MIVLAPHPDDEILGARDFIARANATGGRVGEFVLVDGGRSGPDVCMTTLEARRATECGLGLTALLGDLQPLLMLSCPNGELDSRKPDLTETSTLGLFLGDLAPVTLLVTDPADSDADHKAAFGLT